MVRGGWEGLGWEGRNGMARGGWDGIGGMREIGREEWEGRNSKEERNGELERERWEGRNGMRKEEWNG